MLAHFIGGPAHGYETAIRQPPQRIIDRKLRGYQVGAVAVEVF